jgi:rubrerythrin
MLKDFLKNAFAGESQAAMKYQIFARKAEKEGLDNVARLFRAISFAEYCHARNHLHALEEVGGTADNLQTAIDGEVFETEEMYPAYNLLAVEHGHKKAARATEWAMKAEAVHAEMYGAARNAVEGGSDAEVGKVWVCEPCGWTFEGDGPPERCPVCGSLMERFVEF